MQIKKYKNLKEAFEDILQKDKSYLLIRHTLAPNREVRLHYHKKTNEWLIIDSGKFVVICDRKDQSFHLKKEVICIKFPKKQKHTIEALTSLQYFVIRSEEDRSIYV